MRKVNSGSYKKMNASAAVAMRKNLTFEIEFYDFAKQRFNVAIQKVLGISPKEEEDTTLPPTTTTTTKFPSKKSA